MVPSSLSCSVATQSIRQLQLTMDIGDSFFLSTVHHELTCQPIATQQGGCLRYVISAIFPSSQIGRHVRNFVAHQLIILLVALITIVKGLVIDNRTSTN